MNLARFITRNLDRILVEWEAFARTLTPSSETMDSMALRDHAREILQAIAKDIILPQSPSESRDKSEGTEDADASIDTAAAVHGTLRHTSGFDLRQLFAEFRALRASVLRLWSEDAAQEGRDALYQVTRFNEAIDQALAESVARYSDDVTRSRDTFITILGHDLRSPLQAVTASAALLAGGPVSDTVRVDAVRRIQASTLAMNQMVRDLLEYTRTRLGKAIPIQAARSNLEPILRGSVDDVTAGYPDRSFRLETGADLHAMVDAPRLQQAVTNLLANAVTHGRAGAPIELVGRREGDSVAIAVSNAGGQIPPERLKMIFDPFLQPNAAEQGARHSAQLGLGLFIAREIALGHGGTIDAASADNRTTFTIRIPVTAGSAA